ncbi:MAG: hypothetical protein JNL58_02940 [Planctomyces sp.]|nr:hypothetical protein [Planctomyces sp.]
MKTVASLLSLCLTLIAGVAVAADHHQVLTPVPEVPHAHVHEYVTPLFTNVKYKDLDEMAPCAVPKIVTVKDPCACNDPCDCCGPKCVNIQICVPSCGCELISCKKDGDRVRYDYGKYAIDIRIKKGYIEVDYQD